MLPYLGVFGYSALVKAFHVVTFTFSCFVSEDILIALLLVLGAAEANPSLAVHETTRIPSDNAIEDASLAQQSTTASLASGSSGFINHALEA